MGRSTAEVAGLELLLIKSVAVPNLGGFYVRGRCGAVCHRMRHFSASYGLFGVFTLDSYLFMYLALHTLRISKTALAALFMSSTTRSMKGYLL